LSKQLEYTYYASENLGFGAPPLGVQLWCTMHIDDLAVMKQCVKLCNAGFNVFAWEWDMFQKFGFCVPPQVGLDWPQNSSSGHGTSLYQTARS